ncbi:fungal-specific transcription factor domain-containing protein [Emericellopsis atlantica]|uniref:Fungal-specific transcription factor domain-containing protein n=1 Tax=Emericellopsis atlantica TaxID=2614577 RepID=A0A9P7ZPR0_9HYPO|nr:fungal-specific transcription factor domain-containing protein [Emericellopsis atlantica]KAG9255910.1 fungal-specific transcription factor domain-containing protein [Emericellopsis atlantica]
MDSADMKASIHRFRLRQTSPPETTGRRRPASPVAARDAASASAFAGVGVGVGVGVSSPPSRKGSFAGAAGGGRQSIPACDRCRSFKKKCSRTFPVCELCNTAGQKCSYSNPTNTAEGRALQLDARVQWLSQYINDNILSHGCIEAVETGTDLVPILGASPARRDSAAHSGSVKARVDETSPLDHGSVGATASHASYQPSMATDGSKGYSDQAMPADAAARRFVDAYFRNVNRAYPCVHQSKILADLDIPQEFMKRRRDADSTLLYLVMAIGATTLERAGQVPRGTSRRFDVAYSDIIQECLHRDTMESIQILVLLALYSLFDPLGSSSYSIVGIAARQAILSGLTRRPTEEVGLTPAETELRHRLYWSIFVLDRMMSISHGLPVALTDDNADVPLPGLTIEEFASPDRANYARNLQTSRHVIQLRQLEDRILRQIHLGKRAETAQLAPADRRAIIAQLRAEVEDWYSSGCLTSPMDSDNVSIHSSITWLSARYYHVLVMLYYPNHFNAASGAVTRGELLGFARRQLQSTSALFQQRQLPLNKVSLTRLFPVTLILMHDYAASCQEVAAAASDSSAGNFGSTPLPYAARDEVAVLISILEAFPESWLLAHQAAQVVRQFASVIAGGIRSGGGGSYFGAQPINYSLTTPDPTPPGGAKDRVAEVVRPCISELTSLMKQMLGQTTCFQYMEYPGADTTGQSKGGLGQQGQQQQYQEPLMSPVPPQRSMMSVPQLGGAMSEDAVVNFGWGLDLDFL